MGKCLICKSKKAVPNTKIAGHKNPMISKILVKLCDTCKKKALNRLILKSSEKNIKEWHAIINGLLTSAEIRRIRKKLKLTQREAALICGGGPNAFSRYERGQRIPRATSNLLRMLSKHPNEVQYLLKFCRVNTTASTS
jgi:putative zinc finger/helix-turn-helix YgiT family protein